MKKVGAQKIDQAKKPVTTEQKKKDETTAKKVDQTTHNEITQAAQQQLVKTLVREQEEILKPKVIEKSLEELLGVFMKLKCWQHDSRQYDHLCVNKDCGYADVLLCSKCLLQDEQHVKNCKNSLNSLEMYVPSKVKELQGGREREKVELLEQKVKNIELEVSQKVLNMRSQLEKDLNEIVSCVTVMCSELKTTYLKQIEIYEKEQFTTTQKFKTDLQRHLKLICKEGQEVENELRSHLTNNFDYQNRFQINEFMRNVRSKHNVFSIEQFVLQQTDSLEEFTHDLQKNPYYKTERIQTIKHTLTTLLQDSLRIGQPTSSFFNFTRLKLLPKARNNLKTSTAADQSHEERDWFDKKTVLSNEISEIKDATRDSSMISLQQQVLLQTDHKLPINSIAVINHNTFATCSNEQKIKIWGFTHNYVIYLKATIQLNDLGLQILYRRQTNHLFVATSRGAILVYTLLIKEPSCNELIPELTQEFIGHSRTVRNISLLPHLQNQLVSLSYDKTLKVWDLNDTNKQISPHFSIQLPSDEDSKFLESNEIFTIVATISGHLLVYKNVDETHSLSSRQDTLDNIQQSKLLRENGSPLTSLLTSLSYLGKVKCSKEKITSMILGSKNPYTAYIGSDNGTICILDLSKMCCEQLIEKEEAIPNQNNDGCIVHKFCHIHKQRISSLNLFEDDFLLAFSWDGLANLFDIRTKSVISSSKYILSNDEKKHADGASSKIALAENNNFHIITIGNNDKQIQVFKLQINPPKK